MPRANLTEISPLPWHRADSTQVIAADGSHVADCAKPHDPRRDLRFITSNNAAHIVSCVNACAGLGDDPAQKIKALREALNNLTIRCVRAHDTRTLPAELQDAIGDGIDAAREALRALGG